MTDTNNKLFFLLSLIFGCLVYLLNCFSGVSWCSLVFSLLIFSGNIITQLYGKKKAMLTLALSVATVLALQWNLSYYSSTGKLMENIIIASLISVAISVYWSITIISKLNYNFVTKNLIAAASAVLIDGMVMSVFFINQFSTNKIISLFMKEASYKFLYISFISFYFFLRQKSYLIKEN